MSDIQSTLELIRGRLNDSFQAAAPRIDDWVILSNIVDHDGRAFANAQDKVVMFLANIQHEDIVSEHRREAPDGSQVGAVIAPPIYVDLYLLFYANFAERNYREGLGVISRTIAFFQRNPVFTHETLPALDPAIDKLRFELENLDLAALSRLMGMLGARYLPSVLYKVSVIPFAG